LEKEMTVIGKDLIDLGFPEGAALGAALEHVRQAGLEGDALLAFVAANRPAAGTDSPGADGAL
jgi:tRNA-splicing ligase RtcB (3'-phosphate/5'-hydroxy nucleic acid ligase)